MPIPIKGNSHNNLLEQIQTGSVSEYGRNGVNLVIKKFGDKLKEEYPINYENEVKYGAIKDYMVKFAKKNPELADEIYETHYLSKIDKNCAEILSEINKRFHTKVFLMNGEKKHNAEFILKELEEYERASKGKAKFPNVIDVSCLYNYKNFHNGNSAAFAQHSTNQVVVNGEGNLSYTLRHELMHINEQKYYLSPYKDIPVILARKFKGDKLPYFEEFEKAGIPIEHIPYAYTNASELIAVAAEGDMEKYSEEFKKLLHKFGMPEWAFDLKKNPMQSEHGVFRMTEKGQMEFQKMIDEAPRVSLSDLLGS